MGGPRGVLIQGEVRPLANVWPSGAPGSVPGAASGGLHQGAHDALHLVALPMPTGGHCGFGTPCEVRDIGAQFHLHFLRSPRWGNTCLRLGQVGYSRQSQVAVRPPAGPEMLSPGRAPRDVHERVRWRRRPRVPHAAGGADLLVRGLLSRRRMPLPAGLGTDAKHLACFPCPARWGRASNRQRDGELATLRAAMGA